MQVPSTPPASQSAFLKHQVRDPCCGKSRAATTKPFAASDSATARTLERFPKSPWPNTTSGAHWNAAAGGGQAARFGLAADGTATSASRRVCPHAAWFGLSAPVALSVASTLGNVTS